MTDTDGSRTIAEHAYVVECYWPGVTPDEVAALDRRARSLVTRPPWRRTVRYDGSILVPEDEVAMFEFRADAEAAVVALSRAAGIPFQRIVGAVRQSGGGGGGATPRR
jgi:hypothetical protein